MSEFLKVSENFLHKPTIEFLSEEPPAGLHVETIREGAGALITPGSNIEAHYLGQIWNGQMFDNSYDRGQPFTFRVGVGMVIRGWDEGLIGVREGSRVVLSIPAELGYGSAGVPSAGIKGGDTLVFVTDVLRVH